MASRRVQPRRVYAQSPWSYTCASERKFIARESVHPEKRQLPSSALALDMKLSAEREVHPRTAYMHADGDELIVAEES